MLNKVRIVCITLVYSLLSVSYVSAYDLDAVLPLCCEQINNYQPKFFQLQTGVGVREPDSSTYNIRSSVLFTSMFTIASGIVAYVYKKQADQAYSSYLRTVNSSKLEHQFKRTKRLDKFAGTGLVAMELGLGMMTYLIFFSE
jgi:hypothetical protein